MGMHTRTAAGTFAILILNFLATTSGRPAAEEEKSQTHASGTGKHASGRTMAADHADEVLRLLPYALSRHRQLAVLPIIPEPTT